MQTDDSRELFHATCSGIKTARPPFWVMRQAGRYLPEYRALKEKYGFLQIVKTPELALEAALQPMRRFDFDCSILFSDILAVSEALGYPYNFRQEGGIYLEKTVSSKADIEAMPEACAVCEKLSYTAQALKLMRKEMPRKALIGFAASPFTLAAYMVEGGSAKGGFPKFAEFMKNSPEEFGLLLSKLTEVLSAVALMQISCGIDAFQIFDSNAALTPQDAYEKFSGGYIGEILQNMGGRARTMVFAKGMSARFAEVAPMGADVYSLDSSARLSHIMLTYRAHYSLQGNLDEKLLSEASSQTVRLETKRILEDMAPLGRHIFNLGHGILPDAKLENVEAMCDTVKNFKAQ